MREGTDRPERTEVPDAPEVPEVPDMPDELRENGGDVRYEEKGRNEGNRSNEENRWS